MCHQQWDARDGQQRKNGDCHDRDGQNNGPENLKDIGPFRRCIAGNMNEVDEIARPQ